MVISPVSNQLKHRDGQFYENISKSDTGSCLAAVIVSVVEMVGNEIEHFNGLDVFS